jgi:hypothetical protein
MRKFFKSIIRAMERSSQARANHVLRQMGYTPEKLAKMTNENLNRWV